MSIKEELRDHEDEIRAFLMPIVQRYGKALALKVLDAMIVTEGEVREERREALDSIAEATRQRVDEIRRAGATGEGHE